MRIALPASGTIHLGLILLAVVAWPEVEPNAASGSPAVSVDIVAFESFSANPGAERADAAEALVSAGLDTIAPTPLETIVPEPAIAPTQADPVKAEVPQPSQPPSAQPVASIEPEILVEAEPVQAEPVDTAEIAERVAPLPLLASPAATQPAIAQPTTAIAVEAPAALEPVARTERTMPPVPQTLTRPRSNVPTYPEREVAETPRREAAPAPAPAASAGSGGSDRADSAASAPAAPAAPAPGSQQGSAEVDRYPGAVQAALRRALRYPRGARAEGEVQVSFVVSAGGGVSSVGLARSSGDAELDAAAIDTIHRAAPFPPIPPQAGRTTWSFVMPLYFQR